MTPEGRIKAQGREVCRRLDIYQFPVQQQATSRAGIPDDALCVNGFLVQVEYKAHMRWDKRNKTAYATLPTMKQVVEMERCRQSNGITWVVDDTTVNLMEPTLSRVLKLTSMIEAWGVLHRAPCAWHWSRIEFEQYLAGFGELEYRPGIIYPVFKG